MEIPFKIIEMKEGGSDRVSVIIEIENPVTQLKEELGFNFKSTDFLEDAFIEKIKDALDRKFDTSIEINSANYLGKTFYHKTTKSKVLL